MKILFYNDPSHVFGGTEAYWHDTSCLLREAGIEVRNLSFQLPAYHPLPFFPQKHIINELLQAIDQFKPDIIHLNKNKLFAASIYKVVQTVRLPVVTTVHDFYTVPFSTDTRNRFKRWVYPFRCFANAYIIPSRIYFDQLKKINIPDIHHIPHFIDDREWTFNNHYLANAKNLIYTGRLEKQKGLQVLLEALRILLKKDPGVHLSILGNGSEAHRIKSFVINERLDSHVTMLGEKPRHEVLNHLHGSTLLVMPSLKDEMFGLAGLEAQASGLPVLATSLPGIQEWCRHGETGWIVPPGDAGLLATGIDYLLHHPGLREQMRHQARQQVVNQFQSSFSIPTLIRLYRKLSDVSGNHFQYSPKLQNRRPVATVLKPANYR